MGFFYKIRFPLMASGMICLLAGLWAGLLRLGFDLPPVRPFLYEGHGPFMAACFLGVVIGLERAVAYGRGWAYLAPALTGLGGLALIVDTIGPAGPLLVTLGAAVLVAVNVAIIREQPALFTAVMGAGSAALLVGDAMWLFGTPVYDLVMWWAGFLILTIVGERLELSRYLRPPAWAEWVFMGAAGLFIAGVAVMSIHPDAGAPVAGAGMIALAVWLARFDVARRTIRQAGLTRFVAVCLMSGYAWLAAGGTMTMTAGSWEPGLYYDGALHAVFLGFVFSMIFGHAPIIFPAVLKVDVPYTPLFYVHFALLQVSLISRVGADLAGSFVGQAHGGILNEVSILLFLAVTVGSVIRSKLSKKSAA